MTIIKLIKKARLALKVSADILDFQHFKQEREKELFKESPLTDSGPSGQEKSWELSLEESVPAHLIGGPLIVRPDTNLSPGIYFMRSTFEEDQAQEEAGGIILYKSNTNNISIVKKMIEKRSKENFDVELKPVSISDALNLQVHPVHDTVVRKSWKNILKQAKELYVLGDTGSFLTV